jgi:hypothetical protein
MRFSLILNKIWGSKMSVKLSLKLAIASIFFLLLITCLEKNTFSGNIEPKVLFENRCSKCHSLDKTNRLESKEFWETTVKKMKNKLFSGISDEEAGIITTYLINTKTPPKSEK